LFVFCFFLVKNRHHTALFIQNNYLKLLIRKGPLSSNDKTLYATEWSWKVSQINDNQWHSYELIVNYPKQVNFLFYLNFIQFYIFKIDLYIDKQLIVTNNDNFKVINDQPLTVIQGTEDTMFTLGACWHGKIKNNPLILNPCEYAILNLFRYAK